MWVGGCQWVVMGGHLLGLAQAEGFTVIVCAWAVKVTCSDTIAPWLVEIGCSAVAHVLLRLI